MAVVTDPDIHRALDAYVLRERGIQTMERVTLRIPEQQVEAVERLVETGKYPNRSEAIRAAVRDMLEEDRGDQTNNPRTYVKV